ncbi:hypothetical protein L1887_45112 [Cichorium endivia]|nr:hypothetical protein L1887_45112 [Cichorium endivia]
MFNFFTGPGHRDRIERKAGGPENKQRRCHRGVAEHGKASHNYHKDLNAKHQQTTEAVRKAANRPLPDDPRTHHHRHPEANSGIADALMIQIERHQAVERAQYNPRDNAAVNAQARLTQSQHRPNVGRFLMLAVLVHNAREEQRQDRGEHHARYPRQNAHQIGWQLADHQLTQHGADVINHHIGCQQASTVARSAAAHQRAFNHHPNHRAAYACDKAPCHPAPEADHQAQPGTPGGENQRSQIIAAIKAKALNQAPGH